MTPALRLLWALRNVGVRLWVEGGALHYDAKAGAVPAEIRARVPDVRTDLVRLLTEPCPCSACTEENQEPHGPRCYCPACLDADPKWEAWRQELAEQGRFEKKERRAIEEEGCS